MATPDSRQTFLANLSPWGSRTATPRRPPTPHGADGEGCRNASPAPTQQGRDHVVNRRPRLSLKRYPRDCPPLVVRWFHAVDLFKRKPLSNQTPTLDRSSPKPEKWIPFSQSDSRAIETAFQKTVEDAEAAELRKTSLDASNFASSKASILNTTKVPVNEDYLFDVNIEARELIPAYWLGPVYDVRRGTWFTPDGKAVDESLAMQLEEGYLKVRPWRFSRTDEKSVPLQQRPRPLSAGPGVSDDHRTGPAQLNRNSTSNPVSPASSFDNLKQEASRQQHGVLEEPVASISTASAASPRMYRLFGAYMNSTVTYQDETTAWRLTDDMWTRMGSTLYERFAGGAHYAGIRYIRGYTDPANKNKPASARKRQEKLADHSVIPPLANDLDHGKDSTAGGSDGDCNVEVSGNEAQAESVAQTQKRSLERQVSEFMTSSRFEYEEKQEEEVRKREEEEMRQDYKSESKAEQGREIEHLLLITHGIGQRLGMRLELINFIHDVNTLRKTLKSVYAASPDLQALNSETDSESKNNRIQVIPIVWRHLLDFPQQSLKHNRKEHDLGDDNFDDHEYPNLEDITVEGVPAVRNFLTDLALDILLYQSPVYKEHISRIVVKELNRTYRLWKARNACFEGKISLVGHSLGSAIMFDILCMQKDFQPDSEGRWVDDDLKLDFPVEDFYALGSPIGLFQMLKGRTIAARPGTAFEPQPTCTASLDDLSAPSMGQVQKEQSLDTTVSSPLCKQIFNIFHPTDPISYRIEPLISPAMSSLKAQPLPYTKKGIFGVANTQSITSLPARVGQGMTGFWSSIGSGIANGLLNRSQVGWGSGRGSDDGQEQRTTCPSTSDVEDKSSRGRVGGVEEAGSGWLVEKGRRKVDSHALARGEEGEQRPTLIEADMETLFAGFQKRRKRGQSEEGSARRREDEAEWQQLEERSRKLKKEEAKVRSLNVNGRVDYSIQEGAFDISLLATMASHLAYWADEDVSHFIMSQLLARQRVFEDRNLRTGRGSE